MALTVTLPRGVCEKEEDRTGNNSKELREAEARDETPAETNGGREEWETEVDEHRGWWGVKGRGSDGDRGSEGVQEEGRRRRC